MFIKRRFKKEPPFLFFYLCEMISTSDIKENMKKRFRVLRFIYEDVKGNASKHIELSRFKELVQNNKGIKTDEFEAVREYLKNEGLIKEYDNNYWGITHEGIKVIEFGVLFYTKDIRFEKDRIYFPSLETLEVNLNEL